MKLKALTFNLHTLNDVEGYVRQLNFVRGCLQIYGGITCVYAFPARRLGLRQSGKGWHQMFEETYGRSNVVYAVAFRFALLLVGG